MNVWVHVCRGQRSIFDGVPQELSTLLLRQGLALAQGLWISLGWLASELQGSACLHGSNTGILRSAAMSSFLHRC